MYTTEELMEINVCLDRIYQRSNKRRTIEDLFFRWNRFIDYIEDGYKFTIDDYTNDLGIRDFIQTLVDNCSIKLQTKILGEVAPMDERYIFFTNSVDKPLLPPRIKDRGWWWFRIPKKHTKRFYLLD